VPKTAKHVDCTQGFRGTACTDTTPGATTRHKRVSETNGTSSVFMIPALLRIAIDGIKSLSYDA
jgi:hypothetical protein